jgi:hypothetical protein
VIHHPRRLGLIVPPSPVTLFKAAHNRPFRSRLASRIARATVAPAGQNSWDHTVSRAWSLEVSGYKLNAGGQLDASKQYPAGIVNCPVAVLALHSGVSTGERKPKLPNQADLI